MAHPLLCWDICLEGLHRRMQLANDLRIGYYAQSLPPLRSKVYHP